MLFKCILVLSIINSILSARILGYFSIPSISHQVVFRPLIQELLKRGHEVVIVTTDPAFNEGDAPKNLTEIDVHDISYKLWQEYFLNNVKGNNDDADKVLDKCFFSFNIVFRAQIEHDSVRMLLEGKEDFDLIFTDALSRPSLIFSKIFRAPLIKISTLGGIYPQYLAFGVPSHPLVYPQPLRQRFYNLTFVEKLRALKDEYQFRKMQWYYEDVENQLLKDYFGENASTINELEDKVAMLFVNANPVFEGNNPVPSAVVHLGGLHQRPKNILPKDLQSFLDSSKHGVIYMSFGTNVKMSLLPSQIIQIFNKVFSKLPYDVLMKWDTDTLPGAPDNVKQSKWFPQSDLLRHPNVKLFITQGGMQSTDESITAGVPLLAFPVFADQWYNAEKYVYFGIGKKIELLDVTEDILEAAVTEIINNKSYRENIIHLRTLMNDQPQTPLERAVWWTEYVIRHKGAKHLKSPMANISWAEYLILDVVVFVLAILITIAIICYVILRKFLCKCIGLTKKNKLKIN